MELPVAALAVGVTACLVVHKSGCLEKKHKEDEDSEDSEDSEDEQVGLKAPPGLDFGDFEPFVTAGETEHVTGWQLINLDSVEALDKLAAKKLCVFVIGSYKAGKTTLVQWLTGQDLDPDAVRNTKGEQYYDCKLNQPVLLVDTEGMFQPVDPNSLVIIRDLILEHMFYSCDYVVFVVERLTSVELELLYEIFDLFAEGCRMSKMTIVHNRKDISSTDKLLEYKDQVARVVRNTTAVENEQFLLESSIGEFRKLLVTHMFLADQEKCAEHNTAMLAKIKAKIAHADRAVDEMPMSEGIRLAIKHLLYQFYEFNYADESVVRFEKTRLKVANFLRTEKRGATVQLRRTGQTRIEVVAGPAYNKPDRPGKELLMDFYVLSPGLTLQNLRIEAINSKILHIHVVKAYYPPSLNEEKGCFEEGSRVEAPHPKNGNKFCPAKIIGLEAGKCKVKFLDETEAILCPEEMKATNLVQITKLYHLPSQMSTPNFDQYLNLREDEQHVPVFTVLLLNVGFPEKNPQKNRHR